MPSRLKSFYFMIVSFASLIGLAVSMGSILYATAQHLFITSEEYLQSNRAYEIRMCEDATVYRPEAEATPRSAAEIATCKQERTQEALTQRSIDFKETLLGGISWGLVFAAIFLFHFPTFRKLSEKE